jgi:hypothetical protein
MLSPPEVSVPKKLAGRQTPCWVPPVGPAGYPLSEIGLPVSNRKTNWPVRIGVPVIDPVEVAVQPA